MQGLTDAPRQDLDESDVINVLRHVEGAQIRWGCLFIDQATGDTRSSHRTFQWSGLGFNRGGGSQVEGTALGLTWNGVL